MLGYRGNLAQCYTAAATGQRLMPCDLRQGRGHRAPENPSMAAGDRVHDTRPEQFSEV